MEGEGPQIALGKTHAGNVKFDLLCTADEGVPSWYRISDGCLLGVDLFLDYAAGDGIDYPRYLRFLRVGRGGDQQAAISDGNVEDAISFTFEDDDACQDKDILKRACGHHPVAMLWAIVPINQRTKSLISRFVDLLWKKTDGVQKLTHEEARSQKKLIDDANEEWRTASKVARRAIQNKAHEARQPSKKKKIVLTDVMKQAIATAKKRSEGGDFEEAPVQTKKAKPEPRKGSRSSTRLKK